MYVRKLIDYNNSYAIVTYMSYLCFAESVVCNGFLALATVSTTSEYHASCLRTTTIRRYKKRCACACACMHVRTN